MDRLITGTGIKHLVTITIDTDGPTGDQTASVTATDGHPFWSPELHLWIDAAALQPGQYLRTAAGTWVQITAITHHATIQTVHNLTIHNTHTYYVVMAGVAVLTHNCGLPNRASDADQALEIQAAERRGVVPAVLGEGAGYDGLRSALGGETDFKWAVVAGEGGGHELRVMPAYAGGNSGGWPRMEMAHTVLAGRRGRVLSAGSGNIDDLFGMAAINNWSGHFQPGDDLMRIGEAAFGRAGVPFMTVPRPRG